MLLVTHLPPTSQSLVREHPQAGYRRFRVPFRFSTTVPRAASVPYCIKVLENKLLRLKIDKSSGCPWDRWSAGCLLQQLASHPPYKPLASITAPAPPQRLLRQCHSQYQDVHGTAFALYELRQRKGVQRCSPVRRKVGFFNAALSKLNMPIIHRLACWQYLRRRLKPYDGPLC